MIVLHALTSFPLPFSYISQVLSEVYPRQEEEMRFYFQKCLTNNVCIFDVV